MLRVFVIFAILSILTGCSKSSIHELKSPCVAIDPVEGSSVDSPCARRIPSMNDLV
jgi:hypothetical protein